MTTAVSVVLPTYHRPVLLARALASVLAQRHPPLEVIVVDGGADEETARLLTAWPDDRVRHLRADGGGDVAARNTGIRAASGDAVAFLDDDDQWLPDRLTRQVACLEAAGVGVGVVGCRFRWDDGRERGWERTALPEGSVDTRRALLRRGGVALQTLLVRRRCFDRVGLLDASLGDLAELDLALRLARHYEFRTVPEVLVVRHRPQGAVRGATPQQARALERFIAAQPELRANRELRSEWLLRLARLHARLGDRARWAATVRDAVRTDPANVRALAAWTGGRAAFSPAERGTPGRRSPRGRTRPRT